MSATPPVPAQIAAALRGAADLMNRGRFADARTMLEPAARALPGFGDARYLLGVALVKTGDVAGAERELTAAIAIDPARQDAAIDLARLLNAQRRHEEAIGATAPFAERADARVALLAERAAALQALDRLDELVAVRERIALLSPNSLASHHNLAAALGDAGFAERAEAAARTALRAGDAPETWLVLARALQSQNRYDAAEAAFREALRRRPAYVEARRDLSQLIWMRTGVLAEAAAPLDAAVPPAERRELLAIKARLFDYAGDARGGYALLRRGDIGDDARLQLAAAQLAIGFDPAAALDHARTAARLAPGDDAVERQLIYTHLSAGLPDAALALAERRIALRPHDQSLVAAQWTAWRLLGDPRAEALYDYARMVLAQPIDTPAGWSHAEDYIHDLGTALRREHRLRTHPLDQSLRHGTQTSANLLRSTDPAIRAFTAAIDAPIQHYLGFIGTGGDRLRRHNRARYRIAGLWSVKLRPGGYHVDHVHPMGWISSACHIDLPPAVDAGGQEGWLQFGQPGIPTAPALGPQHRIRPAAGRLVMFPSYMWHGTLPFAGAGERITIAFDLSPG